MAHRIAEKTVDLPPLRVLHRGLAMVPDYRALMDTGTRRHHGLKFDPTLGPEDEFIHPVTNEKSRGNHGGFVKLVDEVVTIKPDDPHYAEYVRHLKDGDLWAADAATANAAGVLFEPEFGGEHPEMSDGEEAKAVIAERKKTQERHLKAIKVASEKAATVAPEAKPALVQVTGHDVPGLAGDGVTDDAPALQAHLDAAGK